MSILFACTCGGVQVFFYLCLLSQNLAAIVDTAQTLDSLLAFFVLGETYALRLWPGPVGVESWGAKDCPPGEQDRGDCVPFSYLVEGETGDDDASMQSSGLILTLGYALCAAFFFYPVGRFGTYGIGRGSVGKMEPISLLFVCVSCL